MKTTSSKPLSKTNYGSLLTSQNSLQLDRNDPGFQILNRSQPAVTPGMNLPQRS